MLKEPKYIFEFSTPSQVLHKDSIHLVGFEFDGTACFRKGTKEGPDALRSVSFGIEGFSPYQNKDLEDITFYDLGNLNLHGPKEIKNVWKQGTDYYLECFPSEKLTANHKIITLGGEHSISYAPIKRHLEAYPELVLLHLDAHADLRDGYEGYHYSHASIIRRVLDHFGPNHQLIQYGIRSGTREEYNWMREHQTLKTSRESFLDSVKAIDDNRPVYLTLDLDYFDPSFLPGTGTPEPGGEDFHSFIKLIKILNQKNFIGADIVELSPKIDSSGNSSVFAAKVVREVILAMSPESK